MSEYIHIGKIVAAHGLTGHLILEHALGKAIHFKGIDAIFIEKNAASFIPYFIQSASAKTETITHLQLEGINTREATALVLGKKVYVPVVKKVAEPVAEAPAEVVAEEAAPEVVAEEAAPEAAADETPAAE